MVKEVTERAKELHDKEFKLPQQKTLVCQIEKNACLECYKEYVNNPLRCSAAVRSYQECVERARKQAKLSERALEMLALPNDGVPKLLLDIACGSGIMELLVLQGLVGGGGVYASDQLKDQVLWACFDEGGTQE